MVPFIDALALGVPVPHHHDPILPIERPRDSHLILGIGIFCLPFQVHLHVLPGPLFHGHERGVVRAGILLVYWICPSSASTSVVPSRRLYLSSHSNRARLVMPSKMAKGHGLAIAGEVIHTNQEQSAQSEDIDQGTFQGCDVGRWCRFCTKRSSPIERSRGGLYRVSYYEGHWTVAMAFPRHVLQTRPSCCVIWHSFQILVSCLSWTSRNSLLESNDVDFELVKPWLMCGLSVAIQSSATTYARESPLLGGARIFPCYSLRHSPVVFSQSRYSLSHLTKFASHNRS